MRTFKDSLGRDWIIEVNYSAKQRVKAACDLDLFDLAVFQKIGADPTLLIDVIFGLCKPEIEKRGVTAEQFVDSLVGDAIEQASDALLQEIIDFFPSSRRTTLRKVLETAQQVQAKAVAHIDEKLNSGELLKQLEKTLIPQSGAAPESSASIPAPSPSVSSI